MSNDTEQRTVILTFRVPPSLAGRIARLAARKGLTRTELILRALLAFIKNAA